MGGFWAGKWSCLARGDEKQDRLLPSGANRAPPRLQDRMPYLGATRLLRGERVDTGPCVVGAQHCLGPHVRYGRGDGRKLWTAITERMPAEPHRGISEPRYGEPTLIRPRLGQGTFRVAVTDHYGRRCAVTGERTLPLLDAAHIRPFAAGGEHEVSNGLLLRTDVHRLFDLGYVTVSGDGRFEVGRRLREDFENGRDYYALHGQSVKVPSDSRYKPAREALEWHQTNKFLG
jgi:HNH endonuclease